MRIMTSVNDPKVQKRFWGKVRFTNSCWEWTGARNRQCPVHGVPMEILRDIPTVFSCPEWVPPDKNASYQSSQPCSYTEPLPPDVALRAAGAERLFEEEEG